jgi:hypothetical protein
VVSGYILKGELWSNEGLGIRDCEKLFALDNLKHRDLYLSTGRRSLRTTNHVPRTRV